MAALGPIPSADGSAVLFTVILAGDSDQTAKHVDALNQLRDTYTTGGTTMYMLGEPTSTDDFKKIADEDLAKGETIGVIVALIVLVIVFGALVASLPPIHLGIVAIAVALGLAALIGSVVALEFLVTNMMTMMGLAVGIDYSLFVVSRYREERREGARSSRRSTWPAARRAGPWCSVGSPW